MTVQAGLCLSWSELPKTGFLASRLICKSLKWFTDVIVDDSVALAYDKLNHVQPSKGSFFGLNILNYDYKIYKVTNRLKLMQ